MANDKTLDEMSQTRPLNELKAPRSQGVVAETLRFLKQERNWWLAPVVIMLLIFGALVVLSSGIAAPFIYTLF